MTYLRWIHKSWNFFWTFTGVLILTLVLVCGVIFGLMQLPAAKDMMTNEIEQRFNNQFNGVLSIGEVTGMIPILLNLKDVRIYADSSQYEPVLEASEVSANLDILALLRSQVVIKGLNLKNPELIFDQNSSKSIDYALTARRTPAENVNDFVETLAHYQILVPSVEIENGQVLLKNLSEKLIGNSVDSLTFHDLSLAMFFEFTEEQRFIDISRFQFKIPEFNIDDGSLTGQIYNDSQFLEFNAFNLKAANSTLRFSGEAEGVNILLGDIPNQITTSDLSFILDELTVDPDQIHSLVPTFPQLPNSVRASLRGGGTLDSLWFENLDLTSGDSYVYGNGYVKNFRDLTRFSYGTTVNGASVDEHLVNILPVNISPVQNTALTELNVQGEVEGSQQAMFATLTANSSRGSIELNGKMNLHGDREFDVSLNTDSLNIGGLLTIDGFPIDESNLNINGTIKSNSLQLLQSKGGLTLTGSQGSIDQRNFDQLSVIANWEDGFIEPNINVRLNGSSITTTGWIDLKQDQNEYSLQGNAVNFELREWLNVSAMAPAVVDLEYELYLAGNSLDELSGQVSLDIPQAIFEDDTLDHHQLYFDFNAPESQNRSFRFTSTAFDATFEGDYVPSNLIALTNQWSNYFKNRIEDEILFEGNSQFDSTYTQIPSESVTISGRLKNINILKAYFPEFPDVTSSSRLNSTFNASSERLLFNGTWQDAEFQFEDHHIDSLIVQITGNFRQNRTLKEFSRLQLQASIGSVNIDFVEAENVELYAELDKDSIYIRNHIAELGGNQNFLVETSGKLSERSLAFDIEDFTFGRNEYTWSHHEDAEVEYFFDHRLKFSNFAFSNLDQYIRIDGTFSNSLSDSVNYEIGGVDLSRVSRIIDGRIPFNGTLNGVFTTRTLTSVPAIQGDIDVEMFEIDNNIVGDINITSRYNSELQRFDTNIDVSTDSSKYPEYYANSGRRGQEFDISGYVQAPKDGEFPESDSLFVFDVDLQNIDMWILPYIGPKVFIEGAGLASGTGKIWGNLDTYDFRADFIVGTDDAAYFVPRFLEAQYYAQGPITFTRDSGLVFKDIFLIDPSGGSAILSGYYDFNDFQPINYMNITLDMDEFQFLNSTFDPTAPFYGTAYGSSMVTISGTNLNPVLTTERPIIISDFSEIGIPLLEETELNEDNKFIRFVRNFDVNLDSAQNVTSASGQLDLGNVDPAELTFAERFTLDLQFEAVNPMTVQLIFDPVTGDIVTADGTGRMRIRLDDEQVSMFGRFDITGGRYQFVSGDIFSRRFDLESGGSITWEGDPANARLDLNAIYRARPDINTLRPRSEEINPENAQRVPVELVLNIGGTISSIENNFYFRLPVTIDSRQNTTFATQLDALNRDEELKLIQSANFLLMGNFIPISATTGSQDYWFGDNISGSAAVLNPLLSSQVISPLLSNQINSLLNSDLSSLDVDFNLTTYNEVDLGVALRLYNDRLILRREGQITGRQSNIGDLGATYRINRTFAVTAFHRQDILFGSTPNTEQVQQSQEINGVGVEANVSFNTWKDFFNRLFSPLRNLFGIQRTEETESITENREDGNSPK